MNIGMIIYIIVLFVILTPGVLLTLPSKDGNNIVTAIVHGLIFAIIFELFHKQLMKSMDYKY